MGFLPSLLLYFLRIGIAFASQTRDQQEWTDYAKFSSPSSKPSIDRLLAFPGPQNDVTNGAPVAPDLKPSADIRPIYMSTVEALTRAINHPPHYEDTRASESTPGMRYNSLGNDKTGSLKSAPPWIFKHISSLPTHWLTKVPQNHDSSFNEVDEMLQPVKVNVDEALQNLTSLMEIVKNGGTASLAFLRPDGSTSQGTRDNSEKLSSVPTKNSHEDKDARLSLLSQETYGDRENDGGLSLKISEFKKENHQEVYPKHTLKKQSVKHESGDSALSNYLPAMPLQDNLISPPQYWSSGERGISHLIDKVNKKIFKMQQQELTSVNKLYQYSKEDVSSGPLEIENKDKLLEEVNNEILNPKQEFPRHSLWNSQTSRNSRNATDKDPFTIGMEIEDLIKNERETQGAMIFPDFKDKFDQVLTELSKFKEIFHEIFEIPYYNNEKKISSTGKVRKSLNAGFPTEELKIKSKINYIPFHHNHILQFTGKGISMPKKFSNIDMQKFWQPDMDITSPSTTHFSSLPLNVPLHYLKDIIKLLDDLQRMKSKSNNYNYDVPSATKDSRRMKMTIKQDNLNLPPGSEEIMQGGTGMTPGKHEGGGFRVKINVPSLH